MAIVIRWRANEGAWRSAGEPVGEGQEVLLAVRWEEAAAVTCRDAGEERAGGGDVSACGDGCYGFGFGGGLVCVVAGKSLGSLLEADFLDLGEAAVDGDVGAGHVAAVVGG